MLRTARPARQTGSRPRAVECGPMSCPELSSDPRTSRGLSPLFWFQPRIPNNNRLAVCGNVDLAVGDQPDNQPLKPFSEGVSAHLFFLYRTPVKVAQIDGAKRD